MPPAHPSSRPYGRNPRRRRARPAASDRHQWTDAEPLLCVAQPGKRIVAVEPPGARRARVVRCIRPIARAASTVSGRSQWTDAKTFREPRSRKSEGYARWCFTSPAHPSSCPCGRNPWRRARLAASDRHQWTDVEPLPCVAQPGKRIVAVELPGTRRARVVREVVRCIRPIARAASTVCASGRHWWTDAEPYRASRSRERESSQWNRPERAGREWYAASVQLPGRRAWFALQAVIGGRTRSFIVRRAVGKENRSGGIARSAPGEGST